MSYKVLFIDDDANYLLACLVEWNSQLTEEANSDSSSIQFAGISFTNNDNPPEKREVEMHYVNSDSTIEQWKSLTSPERKLLRKKLLCQLMQKITEIQPDAILLDMDLGPRSVLRGDVLLNEIRKYYPYIAIVMATRRPDEVRFNEDEHPKAEGLLNLSQHDLSLDKIVGKCEDAINYRGIPLEALEAYERNETDPRFSYLSWAIIQEIANSCPLDNDHPIFFLDGELGSGRRLFALWVRALLYKKLNKPCLPSILTEINCACISTSFDNDKDRTKYLEAIFSPSEGDVLLLTDVDKVPNTMKGAFSKVLTSWRQNACIFATATDSKRVGLEKLPIGIEEIENIDAWELPEDDPENCLISFLPPSLVAPFEARLKKQSPKYKTVDCTDVDYVLSFENEKNRLQNLIDDLDPENHYILAVKNITALESMPNSTKTYFKEWINNVATKTNTCVMVQRIDSTRTASQLLPIVLPAGYKELSNENIPNLEEIERGGVFYFGHTTRTGGRNFTEYLEEQFQVGVVVFDCRLVFSPSPQKRMQYLTDQLMPSEKDCKLLFLRNVDSVPDSHLTAFKSAVERCKGNVYIIATVTNSNNLGCEKLPKDKIEIKLPSLQDRYRFNEISFTDCNDVPELLNKVFPNQECFADRFKLSSDINYIHPEIKKWYLDKLDALLKNKDLSSSDQMLIKDIYNKLNDNSLCSTLEPEASFETLCESIVDRLQPLIRHRGECGAISADADMLLTIQMHDWPGVIFNKTRGIYDLEEILKIAVRKAAVDSVEVNTRHIWISDSEDAKDAETIIEQENASEMTAPRPELVFEVLTRSYAKECQKHNGNPDFEAKSLIEHLNGTYDSIRGVGVLNPLNEIMRSVRKVLDM